MLQSINSSLNFKGEPAVAKKVVAATFKRFAPMGSIAQAEARQDSFTRMASLCLSREDASY